MTLFSCEKVIDFDEEEAEPTVTVNGYLSISDSSYVEVSLSRSILSSSSLKSISDAEVNLFRNGTLLGEMVFSQNFEQSRYVYPELLTETGNYTVQVNVAGFELVQAETVIPDITQLNVTTEVISENAEGEKRIVVEFNDNSASEDYYHLFVINSSEFFSEPTFFESTSEILLENNSNGFQFSGETPSYYNDAYFSDVLFDGERARIELSYFSFEGDGTDSTFIQLVRASEDYYQYHLTVNSFFNSGGPFSTPVQIYNNVENGLGVVAGYGQTESVID